MRHIIDGSESKVTDAINKIGRGIRKVVSWSENIPGKLPEVCAVIWYAIMHFAISAYHEPWFDEAEAWQITRSASISEILFVVPHYEGHTPLWDIILLPFAKGGAPYEASLAIISFLFAGAAIALIVFKSPFPRIVRLLLPFSYFFFYQYGVICRPYCVMLLVFALIGMFYDSRNTKPLRYVLCLGLLAATTAYGLVIAGGISIVWVLEIYREYKLDIKKWVTDKRVHALFGLLLFAVGIIMLILPRPDTYAMADTYEYMRENGIVKRLVYTFLVMPTDVTFFSVWNQYRLLEREIFSNSLFITGAVLGAVLWGVMINVAMKRRTSVMLLLPYTLFAAFSAFTYMSVHHTGIALLFFMFWLWITLNSDGDEQTFFEKKIKKQDYLILKESVIIWLTIMVLTSLYWSTMASIRDVKEIYSVGYEEARFIKDNGLEDCNIMGDFGTIYYKGEVYDFDLNYIWNANSVAPYFEHNIFFNVGKKQDDKNYVTHRIFTDEEETQEIERLRKITPDVIIGEPELSVIYGEELSLEDDYTLVKAYFSQKAWKSDGIYNIEKIYVKNEIAKKLGLEEISTRLIGD